MSAKNKMALGGSRYVQVGDAVDDVLLTIEHGFDVEHQITLRKDEVRLLVRWIEGIRMTRRETDD